MSEKFALYDGSVELVFDAAKHQYKVAGEYVPSVTTALNAIAKPALVPWAAKCAAELFIAEMKPGVALDEVQIRELATRAKNAHRDQATRAAGIGTDVHRWAERFARGENPAPPLNPQIRLGVDAFHAWHRAHDVKSLHVERRVFSRRHQYAGTVDLVAIIDGVRAVVDFKTSTGLWDEYRLQLAAYRQALLEEGVVDDDSDRWMVRFDKSDGSFEAVKLPREDYERDARGFRAALALYRTLAEMKLAARKRAA